MMVDGLNKSFQIKINKDGLEAYWNVNWKNLLLIQRPINELEK
jgi:hypothetical protein